MADTAAGPLSGIRILVVDDNEDNRDVFVQSLRLMGAEVQGAASAEAAVRLFHVVDIVVTDFALPDHDGAWLLEQVTRRPLTVPVILLSGFTATQRPAIADAPFVRKMLKPVEPADLAKVVLDVLGRVGQGEPTPSAP